MRTVWTVYPGHTPEVRKKESSTERCTWKAPSPAPGLPVRPGGVGGGVEPGQENPRGVSSQCPCTLAHGLREAVSACHTACRLWSMPGGLAQRGTILLKVVMLVTEQSPGPEARQCGRATGPGSVGELCHLPFPVSTAMLNISRRRRRGRP